MKTLQLLSRITVMLTALVLALNPSHSWAYKAAVGARAADFKGFDILSRRAVKLDDFFGKWVLVEFWASWCGPCVHELPSMVEKTKHLVSQGKLAVITVSLDDSTTLPELKQILHNCEFPYPVLYDGQEGLSDGSPWSIPAIEWGVTKLPSTFLVNPQGIIVGNELRGDHLLDELLYFLNDNPPQMGLRGYLVVHEDGSTSIFAQVRNSARTSTKLELYTYQVRMIWDNQLNDYKEDVTYADELIASAVVNFDDFCETTYEFLLPSQEELYFLKYYLKAVIPGSEVASTGNSSGIKVMYVGESHTFYDVEYVDGKYVLHR